MATACLGMMPVYCVYQVERFQQSRWQGHLVELFEPLPLKFFSRAHKGIATGWINPEWRKA